MSLYLHSKSHEKDERGAFRLTLSTILIALLVFTLAFSLIPAPRQAFADGEKNINDESINVEPIKNQMANYFDGATPKPVLKDGDYTLIEGTDYKLSYEDNWCISYNPDVDRNIGTDDGAYAKFVKTQSDRTPTGSDDGWDREETYSATRPSDAVNGPGAEAAALLEGFHYPKVIITGMGTYEGVRKESFEIVLRWAARLNNVDEVTGQTIRTKAPYWNYPTEHPFLGKSFPQSRGGLAVYAAIANGTYENYKNNVNISQDFTNQNVFYTNIDADRLLCNLAIRTNNNGRQAYTYGFTGWNASFVNDPKVVLRDKEGDLVTLFDRTTLTSPYAKDDGEGGTRDVELDWDTIRTLKITSGNDSSYSPAYADVEGYYYSWIWAGVRPSFSGTGITSGGTAVVRGEGEDKDIVWTSYWYPLYTGDSITPTLLLKSVTFSNGEVFPRPLSEALKSGEYVFNENQGENSYEVVYEANTTSLSDNKNVADPLGDLGLNTNAKKVGISFYFSGPLVYGRVTSSTNSFTIVQRPIDNDVAAVYTNTSTAIYDDQNLKIKYGIEDEYEYVGKPVTQVVPELKIGETVLPTTDYFIDEDTAFTNNDAVGTGTVTISAAPRTYTGILEGGALDPATAIGGNLSGTVEVPFEIVPAKTLNIDPLSAVAYTGSALTPKPTVKNVYEETLTEGTDYSLTYESNTNPGKGTVKITGMGLYSAAGTKTANFTISGSLPPVDPPPPGDPEDKDPVRLSGNDRYETAKQIILNSFDAATTDTVIVSTGEVFADALTVAGFAGIKDAPIILTSAAALDAHAKEAIQTLAPTNIYVTGGSAAISDAVYDELATLVPAGGTIARLAGSSRADTAIKIFEEGQGSWSNTAVIANGQNFPDALSVSPFAYDIKSPIFLSDPTNGLDSATLQALSSGGFDRMIIVGGPAAVPESVLAQLQSSVPSAGVERWSGDDRYQTSVVIAEKAIADAASSLSYDGTVLATGANFPDALAGAAFAAREGTILLLIDDTPAGRHAIDTFITAHKAAIGHVHILGGESAVSKALEAAADKAYR